MIAFIQSLEAHVFTFKEVAGYVTLAVCMSFSVGFLLAAYTRMSSSESKLNGINITFFGTTREKHPSTLKGTANEPCPECGSVYPHPHYSGCSVGEAYQS